MKLLKYFVPFFILALFVLHNTLDYYYFVSSGTVIKTFFLYLFLLFLVYITGYKIFKNKEKFILQFSTILFIFLFFGAITDTIEKYVSVHKTIGFNTKLVVFFLALCLIIWFATFKMGRHTVSRFLKFWVIYCLVIAVYDIGEFVFIQKKEKKYLIASKALQLHPSPNKPPVFYFIFDSYPSDTALSKYLKFNNNEFSSFLKENNFFVTGNAQSLYDTTYYSLCSTLNLDSLAFYTDPKLEEYKKKLLALRQTEETTLLNAFENAGYIFRNFSVFDLQNQSSILDFNLPFQLGNVITSTTFFNRIYRTLEPATLLARKKIDITFLKEPRSNLIKRDIAKLDKALSKTLQSSSQNNSSFNYFHFMIPHFPSVYNSNGIENNLKDLYTSTDFERSVYFYTEYLKYGNKKIKEIINSIFEKFGQNVIIIIQGDHGYREFAKRFPKKIGFSIMNAVYLPGKNYTNFNDTISPINTFKLVLNDQFGTSFK